MQSQQEPWTVVARQHARLLRPFSAQRLSEALYHVGATAGSIGNRHTELLVDMPRDAGSWTFELGQLQDMLVTLSEQCEDAFNALGVLVDQADGDHARSVDAMVHILQGLSQAPADVAA